MMIQQISPARGSFVAHSSQSSVDRNTPNAWGGHRSTAVNGNGLPMCCFVWKLECLKSDWSKIEAKFRTF